MSEHGYRELSETKNRRAQKVQEQTPLLIQCPDLHATCNETLA